MDVPPKQSETREVSPVTGASFLPHREDYEQAKRAMSRHWRSLPGSKENDVLQHAIHVILTFEATQGCHLP